MATIPKIVVVLTLMLSGLPAASQSVAVRSGDHDTFTRVVFYLQEGSEWSLAQVENTVEIFLEESLGPPDFSRVFDRISRQRLSGIFYDEDRNVVNLVLSCNCVADGVLFGRNLLVVDIREIPPGADVAEKSARLVLPLVSVEPTKNVLEVLYPNAADQIDASQRVTLQPSEQGPADEPRANRFTSLVRRYVANGVLSPIPEAFGPFPDPVFDGEENPAVQVEAKNRLIEFCDQPELFRLPDVAPGQFARSEITRYRQNVVTAAGDPDIVAIEGLARTYLALGFGEEALQAASLLQGSSGVVLAGIAARLSGDQTFDPGGEVDLQRCSDRGYVWALLELPSPYTALALDGPALLRSFGLLPPPLKTHLAPRLANVAVEKGDLETAQLLLNRVKRQDGRKTSEIEYAQASLDLARGHAERARKTLQALAQQSGPVSDEAIRALVETTPANQDDAREVADLVAIKSFENRHSSDADSFMETEFQALIAAGNLQAAAALLIRLEGLKERPLEKLRGAWTEALSQSADVASQIRLIQAQDTRALIGGGVRPILTLAETLQFEGFPELASDILQSLHAPTRDTEIIRSGLLAKVALDLDDPERAVALLENDVADQFPEVLARALFAMGDFAGAASAYAAAGQAEDAARTSFLAEEWTAASGSADIEIRAAAEVALGQSAPSGLDNPDALDDYRAVLTQSELARSQIATSLGE